MYSSKFNFRWVYISFLAAGIFLTVAIYFLTHSDILLSSKNPPKKISAIFTGIIFTVLSFSILYPVIKRAAKVYIEDDCIKIKFFFKSVILHTNTITSIELNARKTGSMFDAEYRIGGIEITSVKNETYFLPDKYFGFKSILKQKLDTFCKRNTIFLIKPIPKKDKLKSSFSSFGEDKFSGNYLTSINGIMLLGVSFFFLCMFFKATSHNAGFTLLISSIIILWCFLFSIQANYFIISADSLLIKNHLLFWKEKAFDMNTIRQVAFVQARKVSNALQIIFEDYKSKKYYAGSLRDRDWRALKRKFEELGIPVFSDLDF